LIVASMVLAFYNSSFVFNNFVEIPYVDKEVSRDIPTSEIELVKLDANQCHDETGNPINLYIFIGHLKNNDPDHYANFGATLKFFDIDKNLVGAIRDLDILIPPKSEIWFANSQLLDHMAVGVDGPFVRDEFEVHEPVLWTSVSPGFQEVLRNYQWTSEIIAYELKKEKLPGNSLTIQIENTGEHTIYRIQVLAAIYNTKDELIDYLWIEDSDLLANRIDISPNQKKEVNLESLSLTGKCVGNSDPNGYKVEYWINALTGFDYLLTSNAKDVIPPIP